MRKTEDMFTRHKKNPILTPDKISSSTNSVFNAGVAKIDNQILLLLRVENREGLSYLVPGISKDGEGGWIIDHASKFSAPQKWILGVEDPRIVWLDHFKKWVITFTELSKSGVTVGLAFTQDFKNRDYQGTILHPDNKDAALFPELIQNRFWIIHRPSSTVKNIWLSHTPTIFEIKNTEILNYWGKPRLLMKADGSPRWDGQHIGLSCPPLKTKKGWLLLYHGVKSTSSGPLYRLGLALLDKENLQVTHRTKEFIMGPEETYEHRGDVPGAIFPCGWIVEGDRVRLYYGAADKTICLATASLNGLLNCVLADPVPAKN